MDTKIKKEKRERRRKKIRAKIFGTSERPRLSIFKSNRYIT
ncbi:MAG: 50S ribosomal protein L18, partial [Patescibacteria group bacterium]